VWRAVYQIGEGDSQVVYEVDVESRECPVALMHRAPESLRLIGEFWRARRVREASGGVLYGPDAAEWPARWFDTVELLQGEVMREEQACQRAVRAAERR
jgi:hypothetical protein